MADLLKKLEEIKSQSTDSKTLHSLLTQLFSSFTLDNPPNCYHSLESYIQQLKLNGHDPELNASVNRMKEPYEDLETDCNKNLALYNVIIIKK